MNSMKQFITWILRLLTGAVFIFSGFVKSVDPWGTIYKMEDYMAALHMPVLRNLIIVFVFLLCAYEFTIGVFLALGCFRRTAPIGAALLMAVMLPLTLWIAIYNPVADCGCFGDAFIISNWATFWKNIVISGAIVWLIIYNHRIRWIIRPHLQWIALLACGAYVAAIGICGYIYQPLIDFRPYAVGTSLITSEDDSDEEEEEYQLVYEKDGRERIFSIEDELPSEDDGWTFVRREVRRGTSDDTLPRESENVEILSSKDNDEPTFRIWSQDGDEDITEDALTGEGGEILLLMPDLADVSVSTTWQINSLYTWAQTHDITMIGVVSATQSQIDEWRDISLASYPIYTAEDTEIKMIARGNPAVVYLQDGIIKWKTTLRALGTEDFQAAGASDDPMKYRRNDQALLYNTTALYIAFMVMLIGLSFFPEIRRFFPSSKLNRGDRGDHEESTHHDKSVR